LWTCNIRGTPTKHMNLNEEERKNQFSESKNNKVRREIFGRKIRDIWWGKGGGTTTFSKSSPPDRLHDFRVKAKNLLLESYCLTCSSEIRRRLKGNM